MVDAGAISDVERWSTRLNVFGWGVRGKQRRYEELQVCELRCEARVAR